MLTPLSDTDLGGILLNGRALDAQLFAAHTAADLRRSIDEVSTLTVTVNDRSRALTRSGLLSGPPPMLSMDGALLEYVSAAKSGSSLTLVFEDAVVAELRRRKGLLTAAEGTSTVTDFARRLVAEVPGAQLVAQPAPANQVALARGSQDEPDGEDSWTALKRLADDRAWRCFVDRGTVYLGSDDWLLSREPARDVLEHTDGVEDLDWEVEVGAPAVQGGFKVTALRWAVPPGTPIRLLDQGPGSGLWLVREYSRPLSSKTATVGLVRPQPPLPEPTAEPRDDGGSSDATGGPAGQVRTGPVSTRGFIWPLSGRITSPFGPRGGRQHGGVDVAAPIGTPVAAAKDGAVLHAGPASGYGIAVYVQHADDTVTRYGHLSRVNVLRGQPVSRGEQVGLSGNTGNSTGPHLHFEVRVAGRAVDPLPHLPRKD